MKTSTAILVAVALTAFVIVLAVSLVYAVNSKTVSSELAAQSQPDSTQSGAGEPIVEQIAPTQTIQPTIALPTAVSPTQPPATQPKIVSADRAAQIALQLMPGSSLQQPPELVNYKGKMAFEVLLNIATVYVDAFNGRILASNAIVVENQQPPTDTGSTDNGGGEQVRDTNPQSDPGSWSDAPQDESPQYSSYDDDEDEDHEDGGDKDHNKKQDGKHKGGGDDHDDGHDEGDDD